MISTYPEYTALTIDLLDDIRSHMNDFEPYSDFNFTSLFCWNIGNKTAVSLLNENLIFTIPDYLSGDIICAPFATKHVDSTLGQVLKDFEKVYLVPEFSIDRIVDNRKFLYSEDFDNNDYIYALDDLTRLDGKSNSKKRNKINNFRKSYEGRFRFENIDTSLKVNQTSILELTHQWARSSYGEESNEADQEVEAIERCLENTRTLGVYWHGLYIDNKLVGYTVNELLPKSFAITHFQKTIKTFKYADAYLTQRVSEELRIMGAKYVNWEQDLGIEGLRRQKKSYRNKSQLKKYTVRFAAGGPNL